MQFYVYLMPECVFRDQLNNRRQAGLFYKQNTRGATVGLATVTVPHTHLFCSELLKREMERVFLDRMKCVERWREKERECDGEQCTLDAEMKGIKETNAQKGRAIFVCSPESRPSFTGHIALWFPHCYSAVCGCRDEMWLYFQEISV